MNTVRVLAMLLCIFMIGGCTVIDARSKEPYCNLHDRLFDVTLVENLGHTEMVSWSYDLAYQAAERAEFPHARTMTVIHSDAWISYSRVSECPACLEAQARWEIEHGGDATRTQRRLYEHAHSDAIDCKGSFKESTCPVHGEPLREDAVPAGFGEPGIWADDFLEAAKSFPYASTKVNLGCVSDEKHTHALVLYCPRCRVAQAEWLRKQPQGTRLPSLTPAFITWKKAWDAEQAQRAASSAPAAATP